MAAIRPLLLPIDPTQKRLVQSPSEPPRAIFLVPLVRSPLRGLDMKSRCLLLRFRPAVGLHQLWGTPLRPVAFCPGVQIETAAAVVSAAHCLPSPSVPPPNTAASPPPGDCSRLASLPRSARPCHPGSHPLPAPASYPAARPAAWANRPRRSGYRAPSREARSPGPAASP